ncbi:MAG: hypothetical protein RR936_15275 [Carnobacterium sp.]|uniref:hypothetical protein n=1 Tax=Carnobacterium sp. TaxID=48221 RepID=UPI002FC9B57C
MRQSNTSYTKDIPILVLGNDSTVEKSISVGSKWKRISSTDEVVPLLVAKTQLA